ncbi:MAG TPA: CDP-alcohol phosphatidyltransferase [Gammaproteobacteria bacterium]|nr:CDP-alcohol phosphatidyltransferase [Gammaproteobacteria bacterium]
MNRALIFSTLLHIIPAQLLLVGSAWTLARAFQLPASITGQSLAIFTGFLLALSPFLRLHQPLTRFGAANAVTLVRTGITALLAGLIGQPARMPELAGLLAALAGIALLLDGVDGWLARRGGMHSPFGARFDMEVDAFLILILATLVWQFDKAGVWVLLSGVLRYLFVAMGGWWPWLNAPLPPRRRRQTVCVMQTAVLALCLAPPLIPPISTLLAAGALGLLTLSFAIDMVWLWRQQKSQSSDQEGSP